MDTNPYEFEFPAKIFEANLVTTPPKMEFKVLLVVVFLWDLVGYFMNTTSKNTSTQISPMNDDAFKLFMLGH